MTAWNRQALGETAAWPRRLPAASDPVFVIASAAATTISSAWVVGWMLVLVRRAAGGFSESPSLAMPWLTVSAGLAVVAITDMARRAHMAPFWAGAAARMGAVLAVLAVMPTGAAAWERAASLIPLGIAVAGVFFAPFIEHRDRWHRGRTIGRDREETPLPPLSRDMPMMIAPTGPGFRQRLERFQTAAEGDRAIGRVIVDVPTGSRTGHAHIGFCPPFVAMPTVEVTSDDDGIEAVVTAAEVVPWGVRVECRLSEPAEEPLAIPVDILAHYAG
jgi:hypothetical protein